MRKLLLMVSILAALVMVYTPMKAATEADILASIDAGLTWLAGKQNADGSWGAQYYKVGKTGLALLKFEHEAIMQGPQSVPPYSSPFDPAYKYHQEVENGLNYLFLTASIPSAGKVCWQAAIPPGQIHPSYVYETSIALMAIAHCAEPNRTVTAAGSPVIGLSYSDVAAAAIAYLADAQVVSGTWAAFAGGWGYDVPPNEFYPNQSTTGYVTLALALAESPLPNGFALSIPPAVKNRLGDPGGWIDDSQCKIPGPYYGASYYLNSGGYLGVVNVLETGNMIFEMNWCGYPVGDQRVIDAVSYINGKWSDPGPNFTNGWYYTGWKGCYQAMFIMMKGLESYGITMVGAHNWYDEVADDIVSAQNINGNGSWGPEYWDDRLGDLGTNKGDTILSTCWALLTLERAPLPEKRTACSCIDFETYVDVTPTADGDYISDDYLLSNLGASFAHSSGLNVWPGFFPEIGKVGSPRTGFAGVSTTSVPCGITTPTSDDMPRQDYQRRVQCSFLANGAGGGTAADLLITFPNPRTEVYGEMISVVPPGIWNIDAYLNGAPVAHRTIPPVPLVFGSGYPVPWLIATKTPFDQIVCSYFGANPTAELALDNLCETAPIHVRIDKLHNCPMGTTQYVNIVVDENCLCLGSFQFFVTWDPYAMTLLNVDKGTIYTNYGWEVLTARINQGGDPICGGAGVRIEGIADVANISGSPSTCILQPGDVFATMKFQLSNDRTLECQYAPIRFCWDECLDNTLRCKNDTDEQDEYYSLAVYELEGSQGGGPYGDRLEITDPGQSLYTLTGAPDACVLNSATPNKPSRQRAVVYKNGGIDFICSDSIDDAIRIEKTHGTLQGHYQDVSVTIQNSDLEMGGFDFLIAYDASALTFTEAQPGDLLDTCDWEYFTYRFGADGNCGDACPSGLLRLIALAETNNGPNHPSCYGPPDTDPHELATMTFYVSNDRTYNCQFAPISFFWGDCADNSISSVDGGTLYIDRAIYDFEDNIIWNEEDDVQFPEDARIPFAGAPDYCLNPDPDKPSAVRAVDFVNGGIDIVCSDSIDLRGDINANGVRDEIADAVMFTNYFISGLSAFGNHVEASIAASDNNADGIPLTVADLVYQIRIIGGTAQPIPKVTPYAVEASVSALVNHSAVAVSTESPVDIGGGYFEFNYSGYEVGEPSLINGASDMTLKFSAQNGVLKVLVYSLEKDTKIPAGTEHIFAVPISGEGTFTLTDVQLSDYYGNLLTVNLANGPVLPTQYALHQNYPNPFNAATTIMYELPSATRVTIDIYNTLGQRVATLVDRDEAPGIHSIVWNGTDDFGKTVATGVYIYRMATPEFTTQKQMVLMK